MRRLSTCASLGASGVISTDLPPLLFAREHLRRAPIQLRHLELVLPVRAARRDARILSQRRDERRDVTRAAAPTRALEPAA